MSSGSDRHAIRAEFIPNPQSQSPRPGRSRRHRKVHLHYACHLSRRSAGVQRFHFQIVNHHLYRQLGQRQWQPRRLAVHARRRCRSLPRRQQRKDISGPRRIRRRYQFAGLPGHRSSSAARRVLREDRRRPFCYRNRDLRRRPAIELNRNRHARQALQSIRNHRAHLSGTRHNHCPRRTVK